MSRLTALSAHTARIVPIATYDSLAVQDRFTGMMAIDPAQIEPRHRGGTRGQS